MGLLGAIKSLLDSTRVLDFLAPLALRLYLAPIFWVAGMSKLNENWLPNENIVAWFGNPDWGLGLPFPWFMALAAAYTEALGALALLFGLAVRWASIPLMATMLVAAVAVHWSNGWFAITPTDPATSAAQPLAQIGIPAARQSLQNSEETGERLDAAKSLLKKHGNYDWLTARGSFVVLNNGIEFAATYFIMLLALFFTGAGRWLSVDYWVARGIENGRDSRVGLR